MSADNALDALDAHLKAWDSPNVFETASGPDSAYAMLSEVMDDVRVLLATEVQAEHPMVVAYHTLFDFKDSLDPLADSEKRYRIYESLAFMARAMQDMDITPPTRFDAPRATTAAEDEAAHARRTQLDEKGNPFR